MLNMDYRRTSLPASIAVKGKTYAIDPDFRIWMKLETLLFDEEIPETFLKWLAVINLTVIDSLSPDIDFKELITALIYFYQLGKPPKTAASSPSEPAYDYNQDWAMIYAAFMQQYHINLMTAQLHWWEFRALFDNLSEQTQLVKVMGYRTIRLERIKDKEQRQRYAELKQFYALEKRKEGKRGQAEIEQELLESIRKEGEKHGGGDQHQYERCG